MKVCGDGALKGFGQTRVRRGLEQRFNCEEIRTCQRQMCHEGCDLWQHYEEAEITDGSARISSKCQQFLTNVFNQL